MGYLNVFNGKPKTKECIPTFLYFSLKILFYLEEKQA